MDKEVKIMWEGKEVDVSIGILNWGDIKGAMEESIVIKEYKGRPMQFRNTELLDDLKLIKAIRKAPFELTMESINKLSEKERYKLTVAMVELENVDVSKSD